MARKRSGIQEVAKWMKDSGRNPFPFQRKIWKAIGAGHSGILHSPTGTGKTLAIWLGAIAEWKDSVAFRSAKEAQEQAGATFAERKATMADRKATKAERKATVPKRKSAMAKRRAAEPIRVIWLTPLRALAADTLLALQEPVTDMQLPWTVERRTSDTSSSLKAKQRKHLPTCLITTPESLSLLLSYPESHSQFHSVTLIVLDEWHELMSSKRGVMAELALARVRRLSPSARTWAVSATIGNVEQAMRTALGSEADPERETVVKAPARRRLSIKSLIPKKIERFPWAGHMGLKSLPSVIEAIESKDSSLVFTNTRSQCERWYAAILQARPDWAAEIGIHHGSLARKTRDWVEQNLDDGKLRAVICTSSLDLGVDFFPVQQVLQVGSPKGIARLMQRAGRSGHYPGGKSELVFVPTHALELVELAAARDALNANRIESRVPLVGSLDLLAQHVVTIAAGKPFDADELFAEVRQTHAFADLTKAQWQWVIDFAVRGGESLRAYPDFSRIAFRDDQFEIFDDKIARRHRMSIGTISSDQEVSVRFLKGGRLGTIEERFVSRLKPGDQFTFAGRTLKLVVMKDMTAYVRKSKGPVTAIPRWAGGRMPLSSELSSAVREKLGQASRGEFKGPEMRSVKPLLELQAERSAIPDEDSLLIERIKTRDGYHTFVYPFEGRLVHEGLAALIAYRISRLTPITFATTINDYGIELLSPTDPPLDEAIENGLFSVDKLLEHVDRSMNAGELDRRQFRDIARVSGLVTGGFPGQNKPTRHLQASSDMFFDVFREYDPKNMLLRQARREVLELQLEQTRLTAALERIANCQMLIRHPKKPTPLAFPLLVDRLRMKLSSEKLSDRIERMLKQYEA